MLKAVIFDMDGVIIDSEPAHVGFEEELFKELGIHVSSEEHNSFIGTTSHYMWEKLKVKHNLSHTPEEFVKNDRGKYFEF